ncbi:MAG: hypothetical protein COT73_07215 [Bdellovibrio sp. CG10_big_fil_rev_8_21_14_0_10_47_8]|nr:MAG: hypothetical protein COT73_07215 [Bdellovibrio sp. CG10_big_fil_rev_8_21_14_0_10_47_8]
MKLFIFAFILGCLSPVASWADCTSPAASAGAIQWFSGSSDFQFCSGTQWTVMTVSVTGTACTNSAGTGKLTYNSPDLQYCNGSFWVNVSGALTGDTCAGVTAGTVTFDSQAGYVKWCDSTNQWRATMVAKPYFILSTSLAYGGNFGGISGANSICLSNLQANDFMGKGYAMVDATHVKAFLCDDTTCNNLNASTTYYLGQAGSVGDGGGTLTTDATGSGPGYTTSWNTATYFGTTAGNYWTGRDVGGSSSYWPLTAYGSSGGSCSNWTLSGGARGRFGIPGSNGTNKWSFDGGCGNSYRLICIVNP